MSAELLIRLPDYFPSLINAMQDGFVLRGTDGTIVEVNSAFCEMVGLDRSGIIGSRPPHAWWPAETHADFADAFTRYVSGARSEDDLIYQRANGEHFPALVTNAPLHDSAGHVIAFIGTVKDISDRVRAEEQIRFQAALIDQVQAAVIATDLAGTIISWNRGAGTLYGWRHDEVIGKPAQNLAFGRESEEIVAELLQTLRDGQAWEGEMVLPRRDGTLVPALLSSSLMLDQAGRPTGIVGVAVDISERKRTEGALRESEDRFRTMANSAPVMLWVDGADGLATWFNNGWLSYRGRTLEQELGTGWMEGVHPADLDRRLDAYHAHLAHQQPFELEYRLRRHDSEYGWIFVRGIPRFDPDGSFAGYIGSCIEISDRKRFEEEQAFLSDATSVLASSLDFRETLASVARLAVPTIADWCVVDAVGEDEKMGQLAVAHVDPAKVDWAWKIQEQFPSNPNSEFGIPRVIRTGQPAVYAEIPDEMLIASARNDEHLALLREVGFTSVMIVPIIARERVLGVISFVSSELGRHYGDRDLALAENLARRAAVAIDNALLYAEAHEAARARDQFLAVAAHELRSPLTSMKGFAQLLLRRATRMPGGAEWIKPLQTIDAQVNRVTGLVNRLLDVSQIEEQRLQLQLEPVDMVEVVRAAAVEAQHATEQHTVSARFAENSLIASVDRTRIEQVLANLLNNAIKYSPAGTAVEIVLQTAGDELIVAVSDEGPGISLEAQERMFERYFRGSSTSRAYSDGLGLGLYVAHGIVDAHGGRMWVESTLGSGTTFSFALPLPGVDAAGRLQPTVGEAEG